MRFCVVGLWHLGTVTAACLASAGADVVGLDFDAGVVSDLAAGVPPIDEPGLGALVTAGVTSGKLSFTTDVSAVGSADVVWIAYDTPVDDDDQADVEYVIDRAQRVLGQLRDGALVVISSQVPVGTTRRLELEFQSLANGRTVSFVYSPENLRLGKAIEAFMKPERIVVGADDERGRPAIAAAFKLIDAPIKWMSVESAEMTKHALNAFLATSVAFINEIACVCEQVGADAQEVADGLKSEPRIGPRAYLSPGGAFAGGTLARDIAFLTAVGREHSLPMHLISSVKFSNGHHAGWTRRSLEQVLGTISGKAIGIWGLAYKPGTNTLRRSGAVELCHWLHEQGAEVQAHDPMIPELPPALRFVRITLDPATAARGASAIIVATPWPQFKDVAAGKIVEVMERPVVIDPNRFLVSSLGADDRISYRSVGVAS